MNKIKLSFHSAVIYLVALLVCSLFALKTGQWLTALAVLAIVSNLCLPRLGFSFDNSLGTLTPNLIVQRALELVYTIRPVLNNISLGFQDLETGAVEANYNATVYTRTLAIPAVQNFRAAASDRADTDVPCTLNNFKQIYYTYTPEQYSGTNRNLLDESAMPMAVALANFMVDTIAGLWTGANFAANLIVPGGWSYTNTLLELRKKLMVAGVPMGLPWFNVNNSNVHTSLLADPILIQWLSRGPNTSIQSGRFDDPLANLVLGEYPSLPPAGNLLGFAGSRDSCVYAARAPKNPEAIPGFDAKFPGNIEIITEPRTKLSVMLTTWIASDLSANMRLCWMYGIAKGNTNNGVRLIAG
jgi:hypothetical protein